MRWPRRTPKRRHRRDWRRLWRYCRCGFRWRCPDDVDLVPMPWPPPPDARPAAPVVPPDNPPPAPRARPTNQRPAWNSPTRSHLVGRAGRLTPAQADRAQDDPR